MATFSSSSSFLIPQTFLQNPTKPFKTHLPKLSLQPLKPQSISLKSIRPRINAVAEGTSVAARTLYVGNIPRTLTDDELREIFEVIGAVEKPEVGCRKNSGRRKFAFVTMKTIEDASAAIEKLNDTQVHGRKIKVEVAGKPPLHCKLSRFEAEESQFVDSKLSRLEAEESQFVDCPREVYVSKHAKTVSRQYSHELVRRVLSLAEASEAMEQVAVCSE